MSPGFFAPHTGDSPRACSGAADESDAAGRADVFAEASLSRRSQAASPQRSSAKPAALTLTYRDKR